MRVRLRTQALATAGQEMAAYARQALLIRHDADAPVLPRAVRVRLRQERLRLRGRRHHRLGGRPGLQARGAVAMDPAAGDLRMILLGPGGATAIDLWMHGDAYRFVVPALDRTLAALRRTVKEVLGDLVRRTAVEQLRRICHPRRQVWLDSRNYKTSSSIEQRNISFCSFNSTCQNSLKDLSIGRGIAADQISKSSFSNVAVMHLGVLFACSQVSSFFKILLVNRQLFLNTNIMYLLFDLLKLDQTCSELG